MTHPFDDQCNQHFPYADLLTYNNSNWQFAVQQLDQFLANVRKISATTTPASDLLQMIDELFGVLSQLRGLSKTARNRFARSISYLGEAMVRELFSALPEMCRSVLLTPTLFPMETSSDGKVRCMLLKLMMPNEVRTVTLNRAQVFCLMCHSFLGLLSVTSRANMVQLYFAAGHEEKRTAEVAKLQCIVHFFIRVSSMDAARRSTFNNQTILFERKCFKDDVNWLNSEKPLTQFDVVTHQAKQSATTVATSDDDSTVEMVIASIESQRGAAQADFANLYIGGGVLSGGCVQEEIRFSVCPETIVSLLLMAPMEDRDSIVIRGAEQFAQTRGYAFKLEYDGPFHDTTPIVDNHVDVTIACVDACDYRRGAVERQYTREAFDREAYKIVSVLNGIGCTRFATGNWGCGVFRGDLPHKAMIQWLAASYAGLAVTYLPYDATGKTTELLKNIASRFAGATVSKLYAVLIQFQELRERNSEVSFVEFLSAMKN